MSARWPEMMQKRIAAEYCGLPLAAFDREVFAGRLPVSIKFGNNDRWRKSAIDRALDIITGEIVADNDDAPYRKRNRERHARKNS